jgi:hypothetical protein
METTPKHEGPCVYILELTGDPINSAGSVIIEIGGVSLDRAKLEALKVQKDAELSKYFDDRCLNPDCQGWEEPFGHDDEETGEHVECECDKNHDEDDDWCYHNSDYSSCPTWDITSCPLL